MKKRSVWIPVLMAVCLGLLACSPTNAPSSDDQHAQKTQAWIMTGEADSMAHPSPQDAYTAQVRVKLGLSGQLQRPAYTWWLAAGKTSALFLAQCDSAGTAFGVGSMELTAGKGWRWRLMMGCLRRPTPGNGTIQNRQYPWLPQGNYQGSSLLDGRQKVSLFLSDTSLFVVAQLNEKPKRPQEALDMSFRHPIAQLGWYARQDNLSLIVAPQGEGGLAFAGSDSAEEGQKMVEDLLGHPEWVSAL